MDDDIISEDVILHRSRPGRVVCMKCRKKFRSPDRLRIRRCPTCKKNEATVGRLGMNMCPDPLETISEEVS